MKNFTKKFLSLFMALSMIATGLFTPTVAHAAKINDFVLVPCSHCTVGIGLGKTNMVTVSCKKGNYKHNHVHKWAATATKKENNQDEITTVSGGKKTTYKSCGLRNGSTQKASYVAQVVYSANNRLISKRSATLNKAFCCGECKLSKTASKNGVITIKTPCCNKTVKFNTATRKWTK